MTIPGPLRWILLALLGLAVAAAVSVLASRLVSQKIGLASQPLSAGKALAPPAPQHVRHPRPSGSDHPQGTTPAPPVTATTATTTAAPTTSIAPTTSVGTAPPPPPAIAPAPSSGGRENHRDD